MKHMRTEGDSAKDELRRSLEYESSSLKINILVLTWTYAIFLIGSLVAFILYLI